MNNLVYLFFTALLLVGPVSVISPSLGRYVGLVPELLSILVLAVILIRVAVSKALLLRPKYLILGALVVFHVLGGVLINSVSPGTLITGIRPYIKWIPLFLLPAVYNFSSDEISRQLKFVLVLALVQCPVALLQKYVFFEGIESGDVVTGTLGDGGSGALSLFLLSAIALALGHYAKRQMNLATFIGLTLVLFIPTTINETKVTLFLLPIVLLVPLFVGTEKQRRVAQTAKGVAVLVILIAVFVPIYTIYQPPEMVDPLSASGAADYLYAEKQWNIARIEKLSDNKIVGIVRQNPKLIGKTEAGGRVDNILLPLRVLSEDPVRLWSGLGLGNVSISSYHSYSGEYSRRIGLISNEVALSFLIWETGVGGAVLFLIFLILILGDSISLSAAKNVVGVLASGWVAVVGVALVTMAYHNFFTLNVLIFSFAYFSGLLAAQRCDAERTGKIQQMATREPK